MDTGVVSDDLYSRIFQSASESLIVVNERGNIVIANPSCLMLFGYKWEELEGKKIEILIPSEYRKGHVIHRSRYSKSPQHRRMGVGRDLFGLRRDGSKIPIEVSLNQVSLEGKTFTIAFIIDITFRKLSEEALKKEKETAQMYLDTAASIFVVIGMDRKVQLVNQKGCEVLGYEEDEIVGEDWFDKFIPEKDRVQVLDVFNKIVDGTMERVEYFENSILCKNEEQRRIEWHNTAIKDEVGFTTATLSSGVDITERTQIEEAKVRAMLEGEENEKKRVAKELHDGLGQTLSALSLHINSLEEYYEQFSDKEKKSFMNTKSLVENAINEVKYISRNIMPRPLEDYGLAKGIEYLCDILNQTGKVKVSFGAHGLKSRFDPKIEVALYRMTQELLNNSIKYADTDEVSVQLIQHENSILLMVEDEGSGFDLTRSRIKSHGLGLKNIQTRTRSLGGTLLLDSTPGEGTSVTIEIPLNN